MWTKPTAQEMRFGFEVTMYVMNKQITCADFQKHKTVNNFFNFFLIFLKKVVDFCCSDVIINTVARRCYKGWR